MKDIYRTELTIPASAAPLAARLHRNIDNLSTRQPVVVVSGSWLTVKEQMADLYAARLAELGYTALTFDFSGWGRSGGQPGQTEMPFRKVSDIIDVTTFARSLSCIQGEVAYLAICASAMYAAAAIERGAPITSLASVAGWFHDSETIPAYYGGAEGVAARIQRAQRAIEESREGAPRYVPAYEEGNEYAGMFIHLDYYANPARGAIPEWRNQMSEETWFHWLTFDGVRPAKRLSVPTLFVHGDDCALPDNVKAIHAATSGSSRLLWKPGFQVDFYDRPDLVDFSLAAAHEHFQASRRQ